MVNFTPEQLALSNSEHAHQSALFCWIRTNRGKQVYGDLLVGTSNLITADETTDLGKAFAIPNGDKRSASAASRLKAEGVVGGVPDIFLPVQRASYGGLWVEMKRPLVRDPAGKIIQRPGTVSEAQNTRINELTYDGYLVAICYTWIEALNAMIKYLRL